MNGRRTDETGTEKEEMKGGRKERERKDRDIKKDTDEKREGGKRKRAKNREVKIRVGRETSFESNINSLV
eukprot:1378424-Amorphochlora_amoeboformis.AAC.1